MSDEREDYVLGEEITATSKAKKQTGTGVLSVRLSTEELTRLDQISRSTGKTLSQLVREAVAAYGGSPGSEQPRVTYGTSDWSTSSGGLLDSSTGPHVRVEVSSPSEAAAR